MNERIEKLKQQAYVTKGGEFCFNGGEVEILDVNLFAELLVKECASIVVDDDNAYDMLKHFGVDN